ncbi:uncharacterized protein LOC141918831 [Strix aluco]|uniref:uncharacterized protein LOC141918831 n=1 Tax=Strix aluco TaxID=111821 RepID=UPI003DA2E59A
MVSSASRSSLQPRRPRPFSDVTPPPARHWLIHSTLLDSGQWRRSLRPDPRWRRRGLQEGGGEAACGARPAGRWARWPAGPPLPSATAAESGRQFWNQSAKLPGSIQPVCGAQHPPLDPQLTKKHLLLEEEACVRTPLQKQQSLPLRPVIPLVTRISDQNALGAAPMTLREKTRPEKFWQLLSSHNTDLDELRKCSWPGVPREVWPVTWRLLSVSTRSCDAGVWGDCAEPGTCAARPSLCPVTRVSSSQTWSSES